MKKLVLASYLRKFHTRNGIVVFFDFSSNFQNFVKQNTGEQYPVVDDDFVDGIADARDLGPDAIGKFGTLK